MNKEHIISYLLFGIGIGATLMFVVFFTAVKANGYFEQSTYDYQKFCQGNLYDRYYGDYFNGTLLECCDDNFYQNKSDGISSMSCKLFNISVFL